MQFREGGPRSQQFQASPNASHMSIDGNLAQAVRKQQHARGGLAANPGEAGQVIPRLLQLDPGKPIK